MYLFFFREDNSSILSFLLIGGVFLGVFDKTSEIMGTQWRFWAGLMDFCSAESGSLPPEWVIDLPKIFEASREWVRKG